ncbi:hypothetical protein XM38_040920 [Halomicronema hongdechloris C2206]|uniref:Late competence development ComFB family protein n=1 Tax=Halomicronema hongdechloris C2206 TaxID=1641165 RepID=A0A1Z3HS41_9CYAN|nr:late competence development ComFB family protein [Halomicronema hongdechloris]ASC73130.1 hypothetical protein XM38_040920 [Halomicronema hongdechloris C2206]
MAITQAPPHRSYVNVMELLVAEEVDRHLKELPPRIAKYVKRVEVETYALNRLPSLYASSERGWQHQYDKAKKEFRNQIRAAVRQALAAVQVDPIRLSEPLKMSDHAEAQAALQALRELFRQEELSWDDVVKRVKYLVGRIAGQSTTPSSGAKSHRTHWRPGTYGADVGWQRKSPQSGHQFGWEDTRYR